MKNILSDSGTYSSCLALNYGVFVVDYEDVDDVLEMAAAVVVCAQEILG